MTASRLLALLVTLALPIAAAWGQQAASAPAPRVRTIVTTDGEIDDQCSMVRYLLYTNEFETLGLVHSSSIHHWQGDADHKADSWQGTEWLDRQLDRYEQVHPSLVRHDGRYPTADALRKLVFVGNVAYPGEMASPTPGSRRIVEVLLDGDPRPVWLQAWGGVNTIARALKTIQDEHPQRMDDVSAKTIIYLIDLQDDTYEKYIAPNWPKLRVILDKGQFSAIGYDWRRHIPKRLRTYFEGPWMQASILRDHGPLCAGYESRHGRFVSEGDSPAFMHLIPTGLRTLEDPSFGGWGGRFAPDGPALHKDASDDDSRFKPIWRWADAFQNDWAARADWCVKSPDQANHPPRVRLGHAADLSARPGQTLTLSAEGSDGDTLSYRWWQYVGPGSYPGKVAIDNPDAPQATLRVPEDLAPGQTIHLICQVRGDGQPPLTRYARVIVHGANP
jgi:hypothetical protein